MGSREKVQKATLFASDFCIYCGGIAESKDHAPPDCLLPATIPDGEQVITVPSCSKCNNSFSEDEGYVRAVLTEVSFDRAVREEFGEKTQRAVARDRRLNSDIKSARLPNGTFSLDDRARTRIERVLRKTVAGFYYVEYGSAPGMRRFTVARLEHCRKVSPEALLNECLKSAGGEISTWPEITPNPRRLERFVILGLTGYDTSFGPGAPWRYYCGDAFRFAFAKWDAKVIACVVEVRKTIAATVLCPWPSGEGPRRRLRKKRSKSDSSKPDAM